MKTIHINTTDFDGDEAHLDGDPENDNTITPDEVNDWIVAEVVLNGRPAGTTDVGGRWYLTICGSSVYVVDLSYVAWRGHYRGGLDINFDEEGSARDALEAYRKTCAED